MASREESMRAYSMPAFGGPGYVVRRWTGDRARWISPMRLERKVPPGNELRAFGADSFRSDAR